MARVPRYPYRVIVAKRIGDALQLEQYNEENLIGAMVRRTAELTKARVTRVEICMVLDESTPAHAADESTRYARSDRRALPRPGVNGASVNGGT